MAGRIKGAYIRTIISILFIERRETEGRTYYRTHAMVDTGQECVGYGRDFKVGDLVEVFHHSKWDVIKMRKPPTELSIAKGIDS